MSRFDPNDEVTFHVIGGPYAGVEIPIPEDGLLLGREVAGPGALPKDPIASRRHAEVRWTRTGGLSVRDLQSTHGTSVNGRHESVAELNEGDMLEIGGTTLEVRVLRGPGSRQRTASGGGSYVEGGQRAHGGGVVVGGSVGGSVTQDNRKYKKTTKIKQPIYIDDEIGWWARARGPAKLVVILGMAVALIGFGIFGYPILAAATDQGGLQQAQKACYAKYPQPGFEQNECLIKAAQTADANRPDRSQFFQLGGALLFAGLVLTIVARLLPGASPRREEPGSW